MKLPRVLAGAVGKVQGKLSYYLLIFYNKKQSFLLYKKYDEFIVI
jgi:hypothetical protein